MRDLARDNPKLIKLVGGQWWLVRIWLLAFFLLILRNHPSVVANIAFFQFVAIGEVFVRLTMVYVCLRVMRLNGSDWFVIVLITPFLLPPGFNLAVVYLVDYAALRTLRRAGLEIGFLGMRASDARKALLANDCINCGYNLTGNVSGVCPECGENVIPPIAIPPRRQH